MAEITPSNFTIMTNAGLDLATQLLGSKNRITAFRAVATDTAYYTADPETIAGLKAITPIKQEGIINDVHDESSNTSVITAAFNQKEIDSDYQLNTLGIFATDENKNEILYAVMCLQHPDYMAKVDTSDVMTYQTKIVVGNSQNVQISLAAADTVTMAQFNAQMAKMIDTDKLKQYLVDNNYADKTYVDTTIGQLPSQTISDTRDVDWTPKRYMDNGVKVTREFKSNKTLNLDDGGFGDTGFSELITDTPWGNSSGGFPFQIAKDTSNSKFFFRIGKSDDEWGAWTSLIPDLPSGLVSLSDDNVTVTATTKDGEQTGVWVTQAKLDSLAKDSNVVHRNPDTGAVSQDLNLLGKGTFRIAPTITDASQDKEDNQVATMADLKSVQKSSWRQLNPDVVSIQKNSSYNTRVGPMNVLCRITEKEKYIALVISGFLATSNASGSFVIDDFTIDLSPLIKNITSVQGFLYHPGSSYQADTTAFTSKGAILTTGRIWIPRDSAFVATVPSSGSLTKVYYDELL